MSDSQMQGIMGAKNAYTAMGYLGEVGLATYDQRLHKLASHASAKATDVTKLYNTLLYNGTGVDIPKVIGLDPGHGETTFGHLIALYPASYYCYPWSLRYAEEVFNTAFKKDSSISETGYRWRNTVLEPGGTKGLFEIFKEFPRHESNDEAFYQYLGIQAKRSEVGLEI